MYLKDLINFIPTGICEQKQFCREVDFNLEN